MRLSPVARTVLVVAFVGLAWSQVRSAGALRLGCSPRLRMAHPPALGDARARGGCATWAAFDPDKTCSAAALEPFVDWEMRGLRELSCGSFDHFGEAVRMADGTHVGVVVHMNCFTCPQILIARALPDHGCDRLVTADAVSPLLRSASSGTLGYYVVNDGFATFHDVRELGPAPAELPVESAPLDEGSTPLHMAVRRGDHTSAKELLARGAKAMARDAKGRTPLHLLGDAPRDRVPDLLGLLLGSGADLVTGDAEGRTPLHTAIDSANIAAIEALIERGAPLGAVDKGGATPLHRAIEREGVGAVELLLRKGASRDARDTGGRTPLVHALRSVRAAFPVGNVPQGARRTIAEMLGARPEDFR